MLPSLNENTNIPMEELITKDNATAVCEKSQYPSNINFRLLGRRIRGVFIKAFSL